MSMKESSHSMFEVEKGSVIFDLKKFGHLTSLGPVVVYRNQKKSLAVLEKVYIHG